MRRIIAVGLIAPLLSITGALLMVGCGGDSSTSDNDGSGDNISEGVEFIRTTDPETGREYVCLWKYEVGTNKAGAGLWCEPVSP